MKMYIDVVLVQILLDNLFRNWLQLLRGFTPRPPAGLRPLPGRGFHPGLRPV